MEKHLVTIEFRYVSKRKYSDGDNICVNKAITVGVFDTLDEAILRGNKQLEIFEKHFDLNPNWNKKKRFSKNGGCFGSANTLISDLGYLRCPFSFFAKITTLHYSDTEETIVEILGDLK